MKVVKKGKGKTPWAGKKVACQGCDSKIQLEENDKLNLVGDQRDGDYYEFNCPECGNNITVAAQLFGNSLVE
ncbi:hypothetical protein A2W54_00395 [Candidatus Giovannonibacteria bacterium RIFCSPHIGHO2_02_43_13]|uniref:Uncharacterized protein n=1 Tax=Candidatus Giovannonibacteria bacterium RIFCSPHIGHO2_02_43_13 TaxID=1798330 RepID=A0A1F5WRH5_9BACT|nr:MAG: hypothetical protein UW28_C0042G0011 [Parcubacteria group bacterium GW2011_GWA2_44_13]OGF74106.1 MAG: hypothetical protein A3E06_01900 [Candidatus Giovannonibacteria bacterium RIFCSPHIGHO2_12_FULL_44_42]OGF78273.1 MAG: hypothetical protein A2W54_00395 [Candidatus Giovannonibacteria bacterium RIFCSPHIGHO2_02_43_13]OGF89479.1 MAG: hypothetical protein A3I94_02780 [Candidatus Giovannonibacteria bacterium RIFCSPLOWO2_02_FULL_43_54]